MVTNVGLRRYVVCCTLVLILLAGATLVLRAAGEREEIGRESDTTSGALFETNCIASDVVVSNRIELKGNVYSIENRGSELRLVSQRFDSAEVGNVQNIPIKDEFSGGKLARAFLAPWAKRGIVCVFDVHVDDRHVYWCATFPKSENGIVNAAEFHFAEIFRSNEHLQVLAINGNFRGDGLVVLFGRVVPDESRNREVRVVAEGAVYLNECPIPAVGGTVTHFGSTASSDAK